MHTCRRSSQSLAANCFISLTLLVNLRIVSLPKVGMPRYLNPFNGIAHNDVPGVHSPLIKLMDGAFIGSFHQAQYLNKQGLPHTELNLVHDVNDKHFE